MGEIKKWPQFEPLREKAEKFFSPERNIRNCPEYIFSIPISRESSLFHHPDPTDRKEAMKMKANIPKELVLAAMNYLTDK